MRLLLTRPSANAVPLAEHLARRGHDVILSPVMEIYPNDTPVPARDGLGGLAFTSANGAYALAAKLDAAGPPKNTEQAIWRSLPAYAVGPQTAKTLSALGWTQIYQAGGDVAALAALIVDHHDKTAGAILHIAGQHRAGNLSAALTQAGLTCHLAVLYEAEPAETLSAAALAALADETTPLDGVLLYSQRSAAHFLRLTAGVAMAQRPVAYCLSPHIGAMMQDAGYETICASTPDEAALLALLP